MANALSLTTGIVVGGDFRVLRPLGAGGMGAVYYAEQISTGKRRALKVMHPQLVADEDLRVRFSREARVGALVESEHVVEVIAAGVDEQSGHPWIAMELLEGADLAQYIEQRGRLEPQLVREVLRQLCHAMAAAHEAGVVHRDLKPENLFVARSKSANSPTAIKVLDFGIAKVAAASKTTATLNMGSPVWMAPEQTDPKAPIGPQTDIWAIGLITFWLLTGRMFWATLEDPGASLHALMREILFETIPKASERAERLGVGERWSERFDPWFACCVSRDPDHRFVDVRELFDGFELALGDWLGEEAPASRGRALSHGATLPVDSIADLPHEPVKIVDSGELSSDPSFSLPPPAIEEEPEPPSVHAATGMAATDSPTVSAAGSPRRSPSALVAWLAFALVALGLVGALARDPPLRLAMEVFPPAPPIEEPAPPPVVTAVPTVSAAPTATATAKVVAKPAAPRAKPFDVDKAQSVIDAKARTARTACKLFTGEMAISAVVTFANTGTVSSVTLSKGSRKFGRRRCVKGYFTHVSVAPFSGPPQTLSTSVVFKSAKE